ncbi:AMP-binding protein, partial [bacterium]|nr:AMP-binding protein [bacterium]
MRQALHFLPTGELDQRLSLSYGELDRAASAIAEVLQSRYAPGSRCMLVYPAGFEFLKAFFGCLYAGMVAVPVAPPERKQALAKFVAITQAATPTVTLATQYYIDKMLAFGDHAGPPAGVECIATDSIASLDTLGPLPLATPESLAFLQFTSGSTGQPKGVMVRHSNLWKNSIAINNAMQNSAESRVLSWLPAFHDMGLIGGLMQPLFSGADVTLMPPHAFLQRPLRWLQHISKLRISHSGGPSFAYEMCVAAATDEDVQNLDLSTWCVAFNGAEPVDARVLDAFAERFKPAGFSPKAYMPCYGLAENTLMVSAAHKEHIPSILSVDREKLNAGKIVVSTAQSNRRITSCGASATEVDVRIVDIDKQVELEDENVGEVWVSGSSLAAGYWALESATAQTFHASLSGREERYLRTGDLGFLHEGQLYITGRLKDLIIVRGLNYYPNDIETTASASAPELVAYGCAAFSVEAAPKRLVVVQEVKRQALRRLDGATLCDQIRAAVAAEEGLTLTDVVLVKPMTLPRTSSGKIQRHQCLQKFVSGETYGVVHHHTLKPTRIVPSQMATSDQALPVTGVGDWLRHQIAKHTQQTYHEIDPGRPFVEFGLDSVALVELSALLAKRMDIDLPPELLFEYTTIDALQTALINTEVATAQDVDFDAEMTLAPDVMLHNPYTGFCPPQKVLITGATGFVAAYLLPELIRGGITELVCLVRCRDACHGFERVRDNLTRYGHRVDHLASLLTIIPADPSQSRMGLNIEMYDKLSREVDTVLHCAGEPGWQKPYR